MAVGTNDRKEKLVAGPTWTAQEPEDETEPHVTVHPSTFQMVCIILVQTINSADWAVILPIDVDVADYIGESAAYASFLVAALYIPFLPSLWLFRVITERSYKWAYLSWAVCCVVGNGLYVFVLMYQPPATALFLVLARFIQGMAQCITYTNKQVIALTTSHDVRNGYQAYYQAGNIQGVAVGAMVCAIITKCVGTKVMLNGAPTYLVGGCLAIACLSLLAGGLMYVLHPHEVDVVPLQYRVRHGKAKAKVDLGAVLPGLSDEDTRRVRIMATNVVGFIRISARSQWQTVSVYLWQRDYGLSIFQSACYFAAVITCAMVTQQHFGNVQHKLPDEVWLKCAEAVAAVSTLAMLRVPGAAPHVALWTYTIASYFYYVSTTVNANVSNVNATKYTIAGSTWFNQSAVTYVQMVTQNMLGRVTGPLLGMWLFNRYGQNGYVWSLAGFNLLTVIVTEAFLPAEDLWETLRSTCRCGCFGSNSEPDVPDIAVAVAVADSHHGRGVSMTPHLRPTAGVAVV